MIDIGGNTGHDLVGLRTAYTNLPGRLIVEDLPATIDVLDTEQLKPIEAMGHDFFTVQQIEGAKEYYMKMVLRDWPANEARKILENIKPAMKLGYSKILINEITIPDMNADCYSTSIDMLMMTAHAAAERRGHDWKALIEAVELRVAKIWGCEYPEKLIKVELPAKIASES
jgi:hypothetical protein